MAKNTRSANTKSAASKRTGTAANKSSNTAKSKTANSRTTASRSSSKATATASYSEETKLKELFLEELKDIYWAEKHTTKVFPKMAKAATSPDLAEAFQEHLSETQGQIERIEQVFELLEMSPRAKKCEAMEGLVKETLSAIEDTDKGTSTRDAALIISAQKAEHYEIASYGSLVQLAKTMGMDEIADILEETLEEEKQTDLRLTELAVSSININAEHESEEEE